MIELAELVMCFFVDGVDFCVVLFFSVVSDHVFSSDFPWLYQK
jgi:hypothetical protein